MTYKHLFLAILASLCLLACNRKLSSSQTNNKSELRVLGYLASSRDWIRGMNAIDFSMITDLNLAFINPDSSGNFAPNDALDSIIQRAHKNNVRVFASIGGGNPPPYMQALMKIDKRDSLISNIVAFAKTYNFDGIDVDIENELVNDQYAPFVYDLYLAVKSSGKLLTAALASWNADLINDSTLAHYDFINIMSYDKTGPWDTTRPGQHSPYSMTENDFNYFNKKRNIPSNKLFAGLPFYGYGFGPGAPVGLSYKQIIATYPGAENKDEVRVPDGGTIYYNGISTIKDKVSFVKKNNAGGVMIWQLLGDTTGALSLLKTINNSK